jgi:type I restriction enzyme, R subunit
MSNFRFLEREWPEIFREATEAESLVRISPKASAIICRSTLEKAVLWLYGHDPELELPYDRTLASLLTQQPFKDILKPSIYREIDLIRRIGNDAAHGKRMREGDALISIRYLFRFLSFLALYYAENEPIVPHFDEGLLPTGREQERKEAELQEMVQRLEAENQRLAKLQEELTERAEREESVRMVLEEQARMVRERREEREQTIDPQTAIPMLVSESETRRLYIDQSLREAGWDNLRQHRELECEVWGMPTSTNPSGVGHADYVLWGNDGRPLAVIEAKRTMADPRQGRHQATLYADCLQKMHGQRPIIYYTNGFDIFLWDDTFGPERKVSGFMTRDELQMAIDRRTDRQDLRKFKVNTAIVGRKYQLEAIQRVAEAFVRTDRHGKLTQGARKALLVMATGSGKTRTAAAMVDMFTKCQWAKRVLFLADRNALVIQAKKAFNEHVPHLSAIDLTKEKEDKGTRLVFSTYPTILNRIDSLQGEDGRFYGPGHFDLIIIDEAHRSVYQKYGAIFRYFDALLVGLTATPKTEVDKNTYHLFEIEDDNPTFSYELEQAVTDGFLVRFQEQPVTLKFLHEGIIYDDLSDEEKAEYEAKFGDPTTDSVPDEIDSEALNKWLFNTDTVDKVLQMLMEHGLKVQGGDRLGKTIIFAKNHHHAVFIEQRFNKNYPQYKGHFLRVIDNYESKALDLLEQFTDETADNDPQIAVSVDMMDTGIDAPRVVNLVFFKRVKSYTKFWQMIGRGTRLCTDLFGPGMDKEKFFLFDFCGNIEYFGVNAEGAEGSSVESIAQRVFKLRLSIIRSIRDKQDATENERELAEAYTDLLHQQIAALDESRFEVRMALRLKVEFSDRSRWNNLSDIEIIDIGDHLAPLPPLDPSDHELSRRFDLLLLQIQLAKVRGGDGSAQVERVRNMARLLTKKSNIPAIASQLETIKAVQQSNFWESAQLNDLEQVRTSVRSLVKFLDAEGQKPVYTNFKDEILPVVGEPPSLGWGKSVKPYKERVESFIRENKHHLTVQKLRTNQPITVEELDEMERILFNGGEAGTREDFIREYGEKPLGSFIRSIVGLDIQAANAAFSEFLQKGNLRADQMTFINNIVMHLEKNGAIDPSMLFEPPFTDVNDQGLMGVFDDAESVRIISIIEDVERRALAS